MRRVIALGAVLCLAACAPARQDPQAALAALRPGMSYAQVRGELASAGWTAEQAEPICGQGYDAICSISFASAQASACLLFEPTAAEPVFDSFSAGDC